MSGQSGWYPLDCLTTWAHVVLLTTKNILTTPNISKEKMENYNYGKWLYHTSQQNMCRKKTVLRSEQWQRGHAWGHNMWTAILSFYYGTFPLQKIDSSFLTLGFCAHGPFLCIGNDFKTRPAPNRNCKEMIYNSISKDLWMHFWNWLHWALEESCDVLIHTIGANLKFITRV